MLHVQGLKVSYAFIIRIIFELSLGRRKEDKESVLLVSNALKRSKMLGVVGKGMHINMLCYNNAPKDSEINQMLANASNDIVLLIGVDGSIISANTAAFCAYGYMDVELVGKHIAQIQTTQSAPLISSQLELASVQGIVFGTVHKRKDGSTFPVRVSSQSIHIDGRPALLSIVRDVSGQAPEVVKTSLAYSELDQIFNFSADAMCIIGKDYTVLRINEALADLVGIPKGQAAKKKCWDLFDNPACNNGNCPLRQILKGKPVVERDVAIFNNNGEKRYCISTSKPFFGGDGNMIGVVQNIKDITKRKQAEQALQQEIAMAAAIQRDLWGSDLDHELVDIKVIAGALKHISGDLCDYKWVKADVLFGYIIDVPGHSLFTALQASALKVLFRQVAARDISLTEKVTWVNDAAIRYFDADSFAAGIAFELDFRKKTLTYTGAGVYAFLGSIEQRQGEFKAPGSFIGVSPFGYFEEFVLPVQSGDSLYFLTDGLSEMLDSEDKHHLRDYAGMVTHLERLATNETKKDDASGLCIRIK
jgi:PAS domain S-box-containing protein